MIFLTASDLALEFAAGVRDKLGVVDQAVLGRVVLGLERAEQRLFGSQDLHRGRRVLGQVHQRACGREKHAQMTRSTGD